MDAFLICRWNCLRRTEIGSKNLAQELDHGHVVSENEKSSRFVGEKSAGRYRCKVLYTSQEMYEMPLIKNSDVLTG